MELPNKEEKQPNKAKKIILILLIVSIFAVIITIALMIYLSNKPQEKIIRKDKLFVDNKEQTMKVEQIMITTADGEKILSIKELSSLIGYNYFKGEYSKFTEDLNKCYVEKSVKVNGENTRSINNIIGLEANSNIIYKTNSESNLDYEYIELDNEILNYNENLYININDVRNSIWSSS